MIIKVQLITGDWKTINVPNGWLQEDVAFRNRILDQNFPDGGSRGWARWLLPGDYTLEIAPV